MMDVIITRHAIKRMKERCGIPRKAAKGLAQKAMCDGVTHAEARGKLKRYISRLYKEYGQANGVRVYGRHIYLFAGSTLITVVHLPHGMEGGMKKG